MLADKRFIHQTFRQKFGIERGKIKYGYAEFSRSTMARSMGATFFCETR
jgi:hypothetical protein